MSFQQASQWFLNIRRNDNVPFDSNKCQRNAENFIVILSYENSLYDNDRYIVVMRLEIYFHCQVFHGV